MRSSFRRRLLAIAALTLFVCAAAITAILFLAHATAEERTAHAHENVTREVERLIGTISVLPLNDRPRIPFQSGELQSGYVAGTIDIGQSVFVREAIEKSFASRGLVVLDEREADGTQVWVGAAPVPGGGGYVYASQRVVAGRETRDLRAVILLLALLSFGLIVASLRTMTAVERDVFELRATLMHLTKDLKFPVKSAALEELNDIAQGVALLAKELDRAQSERETLTRELGNRERLAALGRVAAGIAHEVRNPLAAMKLRADLARASTEATPAIARDLEDIASEISRLDRLVSDLLVVAGRRSGPHADIELGELVAKRIALLVPWAKERGVRLVQEGKAHASIDADAIARAIDNLLRNAIEASKQGDCVDAQIRVDGENAKIEIIDHGEGVAKDRATELFEPFFTTKPEGTGLGLALARAVATAHGGTLSYARQDAATKFTITLSTKGLVEPAKGVG